MTAVTTAQSPRRVAALDRATATRLAETEYQRVEQQLRSLDREQWARPTCCTGWDVRAMAGHMLGMTEMAASVVESARQQRAARKAAGVFIDALTAHQVTTRADLSTIELLDRFAKKGPKAVAGRRRAPGFARRRSMQTQASADGPMEEWTMGFVFDVILTRDPWMHRIDIARACGAPLTLTADHDGVLVADVVQEWAGRHGRPCSVNLTGPAGGTFTFGTGGVELEADAVDFCCALSGRGDHAPALDTPVPF